MIAPVPFLLQKILVLLNPLLMGTGKNRDENLPFRNASWFNVASTGISRRERTW
jgi:hypothetical protein